MAIHYVLSREKWQLRSGICFAFIKFPSDLQQSLPVVVVVVVRTYYELGSHEGYVSNEHAQLERFTVQVDVGVSCQARGWAVSALAVAAVGYCFKLLLQDEDASAQGPSRTSGSESAMANKPAALLGKAGEKLAALSLSAGPWSSDDLPSVPRSLEKTLREVYFHQTSKYILVAGPRGCGKTSTAIAATRAADGTPSTGVLWVRANRGGDVVKHILRKLAPCDDLTAGARGRATGAAFDDLVAVADLDTLPPAFKSAILHRKAVHPTTPTDWVPTVIIELDRELTPVDVGDVCRVAKLLTSEHRLAVVVLVLCDAGASGIPADSDRQVGT